MPHFNWKSYLKPTPKLFRQLGDSLLATSMFLTGYAIMMEHKVTAIIILCVGGVGKFLSNFFED